MNKLKKDALYDELCKVLTIYESDDDLCASDAMAILYDELVKIQVNWEELTSEDTEKPYIDCGPYKDGLWLSRERLDLLSHMDMKGIRYFIKSQLKAL